MMESCITSAGLLIDDGKLYYVGGASSKSLHVISTEQRKRMVATIHIPVQIALIAGSVQLVL